MDNEMLLCTIFAVIASALAVCILVQKSKIRRHLDGIDQMLEAAIDLRFEEQHYDVCRLSSF